jgi:hypothetical protein
LTAFVQSDSGEALTASTDVAVSGSSGVASEAISGAGSTGSIGIGSVSWFAFRTKLKVALTVGAVGVSARKANTRIKVLAGHAGKAFVTIGS